MKYVDFYKIFKNKLVFSLQEILLHDSVFDQRRLSEWIKKGYIKNIIRGWYIFSDVSLNENKLYLIANTINQPSYISCESALSYHNLIPEGVYTTTSVSSKKTVTFTTPIGTFHYYKLSPDLLFGFDFIKDSFGGYKIANKMKTILDFLYLKPHLRSEQDLMDLRIDGDEFLEGFNQKQRDIYLKQFNQKTLTQRANRLLTLLKDNA